ncbi:site-specific DNA-methyltransferase [Sphingomonas citri]
MTLHSPEARAGQHDVLAGLSRQIRLVSPSSLSAVGRKARTHSRDQIAKIAKSITAFGFSVPVLVDENDKIIAGNARVEAAIQLGLAEVPVITLSHLDAAQKRAFVLAENKLATLSGFDRDVLKLEFSELLELDLDFSLELTGFVEPEIDAIVLSSAVSEKPVSVVAGAPTSRRGDLWLLGQHRLLCDDATNAEAVSRLMDGKKARTAFEDGPYNVKIGGHVSGSGKHGEFVMASGEMSDDEFTEFLTRTMLRTAESLVDGGLVYFCMDFRHMRHVLDAAEKSELKLLNLIIWDKQSGGLGSFYRSRHELIFLLAKAGSAHLNQVQLGKHGRDRHNVWCYPGMHGASEDRVRARELHPTVKPLALVRDAILDSTKRGDIVLDLFSGSGTTIVAAHDSGRIGYATELDPVYADTGIMRWQDFSGEEARLEATGQTFREVRAERSGVPSAAPVLPVARARTRRAA